MTAVARRSGQGTLRSAPFDLALVAGVFALALALGAIALSSPTLFIVVVYADVWLLAYPHIASMYTRVAFDRESARAHRFLLFGLPPIVLVATAGVTWVGGVVALNTTYFYWQSWHYTRQSYGIARAYQRTTGTPAMQRDLVSDCVVYAFPLWGLLHRANQRPPEFFGAPVWSPPVPHALVVAASVLALGSFAVWTWQRVRPDARVSQRPRTGHTLFVLSHVMMTVVSYVAVRDITRGWLFINIWHNAQYLLFVWAFNARRFEGGIEPARRFLSRISQRRNAGLYALAVLGISTAFYFVLGQVTARSSWTLLPLVLVTHQTVNFHHYIVDALIWRSPLKATRRPQESAGGRCSAEAPSVSSSSRSPPSPMSSMSTPSS